VKVVIHRRWIVKLLDCFTVELFIIAWAVGREALLYFGSGYTLQVLATRPCTKLQLWAFRFYPAALGQCILFSSYNTSTLLYLRWLYSDAPPLLNSLKCNDEIFGMKKG
jgi:hypothetical protein